MNNKTDSLAQALESRCLLSVTFASPAQYTGIANPTGIAVGNLTASSKPDVVVAGYSPSSPTIPVVGVYLNNGEGAFGTPTLFPFSGAAAGVAVGDFTGSGKIDIAAIDSSTNTLDVFLGDGSGNFTAGAGATLGGTPGDTVVAAGDFTGNGRDDLAVVDPQDQNVQILFSSGTIGLFTAQQTLSVPMPENVIVADFNGDNLPDLAILSGNGSIYVALNEGNGIFAPTVAYSLGLQAASPIAETYADFTGDSLNDLVGAGPTSSGGTFGELINQGAGVFGTATEADISITPAAVLAGNFSADGNTDLAFLTAAGGLTVLPGNGNGTFAAPVSVFSNQLGSVGAQAVAADLNGDGTSDIAYLSDASGGGFGVALDTTGSSTITTPTLTPTVTKSTLPKQAVGGTAVHGAASVVVTNSTAALVKGPVTVSLYASTDGSVDASSALLGSVKKSLKLSAGGVAPVSVALKLPATLGAGTYTLLAQTVDPSGNLTTATSGPTLVVAAPVIALTESFQKLPLPAAAVSGAKTSAAASIRIVNNGNIASSGTTTITLLASPDGLVSDGTPIKTVSRRLVIAPGRSFTVAVPLGKYPAVPNGDYHIVAEVTDPHGASTSVALAGTVNIAAADIDLAGSLASIPATGTIGKSVSITLDLANNGNTPAAGLLQIAFASSPSPDGSNAFDLATLTTRISLKPAASKTLRLRVPLPVGSPTGSVYLVATVDPNDAFSESNEGNNVAVSASPIGIG